MKLQLKAIQHCEFSSQETFCYGANLYLDGKKVAHISNSGQGAADNQHFNDREIEKAVNDYFKSLPKEIYEGMEFDQSLESWCAEQVAAFLIEKDLQKFMKACEAEVSAIAKLRPILCPLFSVMKENLNDCYESMKVSEFVDMCLEIADARGNA